MRCWKTYDFNERNRPALTKWRCPTLFRKPRQRSKSVVEHEIEAMTSLYKLKSSSIECHLWAARVISNRYSWTSVERTCGMASARATSALKMGSRPRRAWLRVIVINLFRRSLTLKQELEHSCHQNRLSTLKLDFKSSILLLRIVFEEVVKLLSQPVMCW